MPPILPYRHGQSTGAGSIGGLSPTAPVVHTRNFITDQTWHLLVGPIGSTLWNFVAGADGGFGSLATAASSFWYFPGSLPRQKQTWEWQFNAAAAGGSYGGMSRLNYHSTTDPSGGAITTIGYYFTRIRNGDTFYISRIDNAGVTNLVTQALAAAMYPLERHRTTMTCLYNPILGTQALRAEYIGRARISNTPGAANYNLAAIADPCYLRVSVDGVDTDVEFASGDALVIANGGLGALTNAGVAAVINNQVATARAWVPTAATYVAISSLTWGALGTIAVEVPGTLDDANTALAYPVAAATAGEYYALESADVNFLYGFNGARGGYTANTGCFLRSYTIEAV